MVVYSLHRNSTENIEVKHVVHVTDNDCIIATAHDKETKKLKIYLINKEGHLYRRDALNNAWLEERREAVCEIVLKALKNARIPRYSTNCVSILN